MNNMKTKIIELLLVLLILSPLIIGFIIVPEQGLLYLKALVMATGAVLTFKYLTDL